jgi:hypothetical protein
VCIELSVGKPPTKGGVLKVLLALLGHGSAVNWVLAHCNTQQSYGFLQSGRDNIRATMMLADKVKKAGVVGAAVVDFRRM